MREQTAFSQLLDQVTAILELRKKMPPVPGENFNIFSVMHMETKEVDTHCRLLYELLSPGGSHGMGDCFLESFFKLVLQKPYPGSAAVSVYREYVIKPEDDNYGRIDLMFQGKGFCYPIEVKVYAGDQWEQVKRYAHVSSDAQVYYLTLDGHPPSEDSLGGIEVSDVVCLSFADDIRGWLKRYVPGIDGGFLLLAFLLGITPVNPLPPHYLCPRCKHFEFSNKVDDGFDLPTHVCRHCDADMQGDGHGLELEDCAAYLAERRHAYEPFTEWRVSQGGKALIGEILSLCGPVTPFFIVEFEEAPGRLAGSYGDTEGGRTEVGGWVLSPPEALPVTKWRTVEYPEGSGQFVQAFFRQDESFLLSGMYTVFDSGDSARLALLCRETNVLPESIPCQGEGGFFDAAKKISAGFYQPDSPSAKAAGITRAILSRQLEWFAKHYPTEYAKSES